MNKPSFRQETDFLGSRSIPAAAYWGVHTARAVENFPIWGQPLSCMPELVRSLAWVKKAAVQANVQLRVIDAERAGFIAAACDDLLAGISGVPVVKAPNLVEATQDTGAFVQVSGVLKRVACKLSKTCHDLRLLSSGPQAGFGDIALPPRQAGSSSMPGKVNPVIPEVINQVAFEVIGNDVTITMAAAAGQLQLNAFEPIIGWSLHKSVRHLRRACVTLRLHCVAGIQSNRKLLERRVAESATLATALNPLIGYGKAALVVKTALATGATIAEAALALGFMSADELRTLLVAQLLTEPIRCGAASVQR